MRKISKLQKPSMKNLLDKKVILWDFDGVLMDSMPVRDRGFELVLKDFPSEEIEQLMKFHRANGGLSRYVKFRYFFEEIRKSTISQKEIAEWASKFSEVMKKELRDKTLLIKDSLNFVELNSNLMSMHIVSGSDQAELRYLCQELGIAFHFKSINGSPTPKTELVSEILKTYKYNKEDVVLVGDSINDCEAAHSNGIDFIGYNNEDLKKKSPYYIEQFIEIGK